jgi:hypothetical protein
VSLNLFNDVAYIHGLLLPVIVIDTQWAGEYKRSSLALLTTFAGCPCNQAPAFLGSTKGVPALFHRKIITVMIVLPVLALAAWAQTSPQAQQGQPDQDFSQRKPSRHSGLPVVGEFERSRESDADEKHRKVREDRYENDATRAHAPISDPGTLVGTESTSATIIDSIVVSDGAPGISPALVIGTVLGGNSFISKNRTAVYSDYQVRVDEVLKRGAAKTLAVGDQLVASRPGGAIQFPSGHRGYFLIHGQGFPEIGSQYVLYLWKPVPNQPVWEIISGYQLKSGRVYALDEVNERSYDGMSESVFLDLVKKGAGQ